MYGRIILKFILDKWSASVCVCVCVVWICLARNGFHWRALVSIVNNLQVP
jgi:hypothetical protein